MKKTLLLSFVFFAVSFKVVASDTNDKAASGDNTENVADTYKLPERHISHLTRMAVVTLGYHFKILSPTRHISHLTKPAIVTPEKQEFDIIAEKASETTGLPLFFVHKLFGDSAIFAIDESRLLEIITKRLSDHYGVDHISVKPVPYKIMGREQFPTILIKIDPVDTPDLWTTVSNNPNGEQPVNDLLSNQIINLVHIPVNAYAETEERWVSVVPSFQEILEMLSSGLADASKGGHVEFVHISNSN